MYLLKIRSLASRAIRKALFKFIPIERKLPFSYWLHILNGEYENELKHLNRICKGGKVAIDIGANEGLFSYIMSQHFDKVYSFEINDDLTKYLDAYNTGNIEIINQGLSSKAGEATLYIPIRPHDRYHLIGYASLAPGNYPEAIEHVEKDVSLCMLDRFDLSGVNFIKIDVEGHELEVLKGGVQTLTRCRPIILVEVKDENLTSIFDFFANLKFNKYKLEDLIDTALSSYMEYTNIVRRLT